MNSILKFSVLSLLVGGFYCSNTQAALTLTTTGTVAYTFNTYDGAAAPADWDISASNPTFTYQGIDRGSGTSAGPRAYTNGLPSVNRALGFLGNTSTLTNFFADLTVSNNTGITLTSLTLSFDILQYRIVTNARVSSITFTDVSGLGLNSQSFLATTNAPASGFQDPPVALGSYNQTLTGLNIANGDTFTFRWTYSTGPSSGSAQGLALDNIQLTVIPEPSTFVLVGLALLPLMFRRRRG